MSATLDNWIATSGTWSNPVNWQNGLPGTNAIATVGGTAAETIAFATTAAIAGLNGTDAAATLAMTKGTLTLAAGGGWAGEVSQDGGTLVVAADTLAIAGTYLGFAAGSTAIAGGATLQLTGGGTLHGSITGAGTLLLAGGEAYTAISASAFNAGTVEIADYGGTATLGASPIVAGSFALDSGVLALGGDTLTLAGTSYLAGTVSGHGTLAVSGSGVIGYLTVNAGATLADSGTLLESGGLQIGSSTTDSGVVSIAAGGTYEFVNDVGISVDGTARLVNAGTLEKAGGTGNSFVAANVSNTGTILVTQGTIGLTGSSDVIAGTVAGAGTLDVLGGTLGLGNVTLTVGGFGIYDGNTVVNVTASPVYGGNFVLDGGTLNISAGHAISLHGDDYLRGLIDGPGNVAVSGSADVAFLTLGGETTLTDSGLITEDQPMTIGDGTTDTATLSVTSTGTFDLLLDNAAVNALGTATIRNAGLFEKTGAGDASTVFANMASTGTLSAAAGNTLVLEGASNTLSGALLGAGEIDLRNGGTFAIAAGTTLGVATLGIFDNATTVMLAGTSSYAGLLELGGGTIDYAAAGALALSNADSLDGLIEGRVTVTATGPVQTGGMALADGAGVVDALGATQLGNVTLGTGTTLRVDAAATYDVASDTNISGSGSALISNAGLFEKTAVDGSTYVSADVSSTGTLQDTLGTLALEGESNTIGGSLEGAGEIDLRGGGTFALSASVIFGVGTLGIYDNATTVTLASDRADTTGVFNLGDGATLALDGFWLKLHDATLSATIEGAGTLLESATAETGGLVLTGGATLEDSGVVFQDGNVQLGTGSADAATLQIDAGRQYQIRTDNNIAASGTAAIDNAGLFEKTGATGSSAVGADVDSTGTLAVTSGTLALEGAANTLAGTITGASELDLDAGTTTLGANVVLSVGTLGIYGNATTAMLSSGESFAGTFALGSGAGLALNAETITLAGAALLDGALSGPGEMVVAGSADMSRLDIAAATLAVTGTLTQDSFTTIGSGADNDGTIAVMSGGVFDLLSDDGIDLSDTNPATATGTATISNAGTFEKTGADATSYVQAAVDNTGRILGDSGTIDFQGVLTNDGTVTATAAGVLMTGGLGEDAGDHGQFDIGTDGVVAIGSGVGVDAGQSFAFTGSNGTLRLYDPAAFGGTVTGFVAGDTIDLANPSPIGSFEVNGLSYSGGVITLTETQNGTLDATYTIAAPGISNPGALELINDDATGTAIVLNHTGPDFTSPSGSIIGDYWTADASGNWSDGNWFQVVPEPPPVYSETIDVQPNAGNDAVFEPSGTSDFTVTYDETDTVNSLTGGFQSTLDITGGTLTINDGGLWNEDFNNTGGTLDAVTGWQAYGATTLAAGATDEVDAGTLLVGGGTTAEPDGGVLAGTVDGQGEFYLEGGTWFTAEPGFSITSGIFDLGVNGDGYGTTLTLDTNLSYAGTFIQTDYNGNPATLELNGHTLTLSGKTSYLNGYVQGAGGLTLTGTAEVGAMAIDTDGTFTVRGSVDQDGLLTIGNSVITPDNSELLVTSTGTWDIVNNAGINWGGNATLDNAGLFEKTGGTGSSIVGGNTFTTTGKLEVNIGTLIVTPYVGNLGGAISGAGTLDLGLGQFTLDAGASVTTSALSLILIDDGFGISLTLDENFAYSGAFSTNGFSTFDTNGFTAALHGSTYLSGLIDGGGLVNLTGPTDVDGLSLQNSTTINLTGTVTQDGLMTIGAGTTPDNSMVDIHPAGIWDLVDNEGINFYGNSTFENTGLLEKTAGTGTSVVGATNFTNTSKIEVNTGTLILNPLNANLGGSISGAGWLDLGLGQFTLDAGATITTPGLSLILIDDGFSIGLTLAENFAYAGTFSSNGFATLALDGHNATFSGASYLSGTVTGTGTLALSGTATIQGVTISDAVVSVTGTVESDANINMANGAVLAIASGGVFDMLTDGNAETSGAASNAGLIEKTYGTGTSYIQGNLTNTGTITAASGTIDFQYAANSTIGGTISGAGSVLFVGGGNYTLDAGAVFSVATLGLNGNFIFGLSYTFTDDFDFSGGTLSLNTHAINLAGPSTLDGTIAGSSTVLVEASRLATTYGLTLAGSTVLKVAGTLLDEGAIAFGTSTSDATTLAITATGTLNLNADSYSNFDGTPVLTNAGLIEKTGVTNTSTLDATLTNTGTILVSQGTLAIVVPGTGSLGGKVEGAGTFALDGGVTTLAPGLSMTIAGFALNGTAVLGQTMSYAGTYALNGIQDLNGDSLTLSGAALLSGGTITGPGTLTTSGTATLGYASVDGGGTLNNAGAMAQVGNLTDGDAGGVGAAVNASAGTWNFIGDGGIFSENTIDGTFTNSGLLEKTAGTATSQIVADFTNTGTGTIDVVTGTIGLGESGVTTTLAGTIEGTGSLLVAGFATISSLSVTGASPNFAGGLSVSGTLVDTGATLFTGGTLSGAGTIDIASHGVVQVNGSAAAGATVAFLDATGTIALASPASFAGTIAGLVAGDTIDLLNTPAGSVTGFGYAANTLTIDVAGGSPYLLTVPGSFSSGSFHVASDGHNGAAITI